MGTSKHCPQLSMTQHRWPSVTQQHWQRARQHLAMSEAALLTESLSAPTHTQTGRSLSVEADSTTQGHNELNSAMESFAIAIDETASTRAHALSQDPMNETVPATAGASAVELHGPALLSSWDRPERIPTGNNEHVTVEIAIVQGDGSAPFESTRTPEITSAAAGQAAVVAAALTTSEASSPTASAIEQTSPRHAIESMRKEAEGLHSDDQLLLGLELGRPATQGVRMSSTLGLQCSAPSLSSAEHIIRRSAPCLVSAVAASEDGDTELRPHHVSDGVPAGVPAQVPKLEIPPAPAHRQLPRREAPDLSSRRPAACRPVPALVPRLALPPPVHPHIRLRPYDADREDPVDYVRASISRATIRGAAVTAQRTLPSSSRPPSASALLISTVYNRRDPMEEAPSPHGTQNRHPAPRRSASQPALSSLQLHSISLRCTAHSQLDVWELPRVE